MHLQKDQMAPSFKVEDIFGNKIDSQSLPNQKTLLSFFRYAECAICQLRMVEIMREKTKLKAADVGVIAVFQSPKDSLLKNIVDKTWFDFPIIADPERKLYDLYGVKPSWLKAIKTLNLSGLKRVGQSIKAGFKPGGKVEGNFYQIPADFIVDRNGKILKAKYGENVIDHVDLSELLM